MSHSHIVTVSPRPPPARQEARACMVNASTGGIVEPPETLPVSLPRKLHAITAAVLILGALLAGWIFHRTPLDPGALILFLGWGLLAGFESRTEYRAGRLRLTLVPPAICT